MSVLPVSSHQEIVNRLKASIESGKHWYLALIEALRDYPEDDYTIAGEALDWLRLAKLLAGEAGSLIDAQEFARFFRYGKIPLKISSHEAKHLIGGKKYNLYLNYLYGVTVEAALLEAVGREVEKEYSSLGLPRPGDAVSHAFSRIYGAERAVLKEVFHAAYPLLARTETAETEFTYWLFKYRLKNSDKEKVASDTKKALNWLNSRGTLFPRLF
ncbi:MAG: hypothetical protein JW954_07420 [Dehalococcoidaceae bacterium]|nr:hypothetical protein [Dehalococcoidaceae bacterium]